MATFLKKRISIYIQAGFYFFAGTNHFIHPEFYLPLIPNYLPAHDLINTLAGLAEMLFGLGLIVPSSRRLAALGIISMLIAFIPSHVYFIAIGGCVDSGLCAPIWAGWLRLILIHPLLIWWAWSARS